MRALIWPDSSYDHRVILETRALVESDLPIHSKVALLEMAIVDEESHVALLEEAFALADEKRRTRLQGVIDLRKRACAHFRMTVKSLAIQSEGAEGLQRYSAVANGHAEADEGVPFMEYSS